LQQLDCNGSNVGYVVGKVGIHLHQQHFLSLRIVSALYFPYK